MEIGKLMGRERPFSTSSRSRLDFEDLVTGPREVDRLQVPTTHPARGENLKGGACPCNPRQLQLRGVQVSLLCLASFFLSCSVLALALYPVSPCRAEARKGQGDRTAETEKGNVSRGVNLVAARPRIGLALAGGGALGFAHVGVLKVLEANRIPVDFVTGTSMGAIVGAAYAAGVDLQIMESILTETDWDGLFSESVSRQELPYRYKVGRQREIYGDTKIALKDGTLAMPMGAIEGQHVLPLLQKLLGRVSTPCDYDALPIPFRGVAADIETGEAFIPSSGDLPTLVRASMSVPGVFSPVEIDGKMLVDGGIVNNLPIDVVKEMGAEKVIAVELYATFKKRNELTSPLSISGQIVSMLLAQNSALQRKLLTSNDVLIAPDLEGFSASDFVKGAEIMKKGEEAALRALDQLKHLAVSGEQYAKIIAARTRQNSETPSVIASVRLENNSHLPDSVLLEKAAVQTGDTFERDTLEKGIDSIYNLGAFSNVSYEVKDSPAGKDVVIHAQKKGWQDDYFRIGAAIQDDFSGNEAYRLGAIYRDTDISTAGSYLDLEGEIGLTPKLQAELYQLLYSERPYFLLPKVVLGRSNLLLTQDSSTVAQYFRDTVIGSIALGSQLSNDGEVRVGVNRGLGRLDRNIGDPSLRNQSYDIGEIEAVLDIDTLDNPDLPSAGSRLSASTVSSLPSLGGTDEFNQLKSLATRAFTFDTLTLSLKFDGTTTFQRLPAERSLALGGFLDVSGYAQNSIVASDYALGQAMLIHRVTSFKSPILNYAFFLGSSFEVLSYRSDIAAIKDKSGLVSGSAFIGLDTPVLPLYLGIGKAEGPYTSVYLALGRIGARQR